MIESTNRDNSVILLTILKFFFSHITLIKIASIMMNRSSGNNHLFIPSLSKKACSCAILIQVVICTSSSQFTKNFYLE